MADNGASAPNSPIPVFDLATNYAEGNACLRSRRVALSEVELKQLWLTATPGRAVGLLFAIRTTVFGTLYPWHLERQVIQTALCRDRTPQN